MTVTHSPSSNPLTAASPESEFVVSIPRHQPYWKRQVFWIGILLGQCLSAAITGTNIFTKLLANQKVFIPTIQSMLNYVLLTIVYVSVSCYISPKRFYKTLKENILCLLLLGLIDTEANYFVVKAFAYTSSLSAAILSAFTTPVVVVLSYFFFKVHYKAIHLLAVFVCLAGLGCLIYCDSVSIIDFGIAGIDPVKGDLLILVGSFLYAVTNVLEEFLSKSIPFYHVLASIGIFGTLFSSIQLALLEFDELSTIVWTSQFVYYFFGFGLSMFCFYSITPIYLSSYSAAMFNLNLLGSDFYIFIASLCLFNVEMHTLYPVAFMIVIFGIVLFNLKPPLYASQVHNEDCFMTDSYEQA